MRKKDSKRRWKARCDLGVDIPREAIEEHGLIRWFVFQHVNIHTQFYRAVFRKSEIAL